MLLLGAVYFLVFLLVWRSMRGRASRAVGFGARFLEFLLAVNWWYFAFFAIAYLVKPERNNANS